jgi:hypothetical protein
VAVRYITFQNFVLNICEGMIPAMEFVNYHRYKRTEDVKVYIILCSKLWRRKIICKRIGRSENNGLREILEVL